MEKFLSPERMWPWQNNPEWQIHATCMEVGEDAQYAFRLPLMAKQIKVLFDEEPQELERFAKESQASQAEAMKFFVERFRSGKWARTGIIWWNLIDGWPQFSDAVTDYYYARKLAYYVTKRSQQPICLMFREPENGKLELVGANEYLEDVNISYRVRELKTGATVAAGTTLLAKNSAQTIAYVDHLPEGMHFYVMEWESAKHSGRNYYVCAPVPYSFDEYYGFMKESGMWEADFLA
jgi:beta-mannosidase